MRITLSRLLLKAMRPNGKAMDLTSFNQIHLESIKKQLVNWANQVNVNLYKISYSEGNSHVWLKGLVRLDRSG